LYSPPFSRGGRGGFNPSQASGLAIGFGTAEQWKGAGSPYKAKVQKSIN